MLAAAKVALGPRPAAPPFLLEPLTTPVTRAAGDDLALSDLVQFFRDPVKGFFRALDLTLPWDVDGVSDAMPVEIDQLESWGVGDRMLADMLRGIHPDMAPRDRVAPRCAATRHARLAQGHRGPRDRDEPRGRRAHPPSGGATLARRRHRAARRPPAHRHHHARVRRPAGRGRLLQARRQAAARVVGPAAGARGRPPRPQLDGAHHRPGTARQPGRAAAAGPDGRRAADAAQRPRRPLRRGPPGSRSPLPIKTSFAWASAVLIGQEPSAERRSRSGRAAASPARTPTPHTSGSGASTPTSTASPGWASWPSGSGCRCCAANGGRC